MLTIKTNIFRVTAIFLLALSYFTCSAQDSLMHIRGEMIVQLSEQVMSNLGWTSPSTPHVTTTNNSLTALLDTISGYSMEQMCVECTDSIFGGGAGMDRMFVVRYNSALDPDSLAEEMVKNTNIIKAHPNLGIALYQVVPNDPEYEYQYHLHDINAEEAWEIQTGDENIKIAVLDGMFTKNPANNGNPDLVGKYMLYPNENQDFLDWNWEEYQAKGYSEPDTSINFDYEDVDSDPFDAYLLPQLDHGLAVSSIISARTNTSPAEGGAGVVWNATLVPCRAFDAVWNDDSNRMETIGEADDIFSAIRWIVNPSGEARADIVNCSWGVERDDYAPENDEYIILTQITKLIQYSSKYKNVLWVAASGNPYPISGSIFSASGWPAFMPEVISVGAITTSTHEWVEDFGNGRHSAIGYNEDELYVSAYGKGVWTTSVNDSSVYSYSGKTGTSMAAPQVTGLIALLKSENPNITLNGVKNILRESCDKVEPMDTSRNIYREVYGYNEEENFSWLCGYGRINLYNALSIAHDEKELIIQNELPDSSTNYGMVNYEGINHNSPYTVLEKTYTPIMIRTNELPFVPEAISGHDVSSKYAIWTITDNEGTNTHVGLYLYDEPGMNRTYTATFSQTLEVDLHSRIDGMENVDIEWYFKDPFRYTEFMGDWYHSNMFLKETGQLELRNDVNTDGGAVKGFPFDIEDIQEPYYAMKYSKYLEYDNGTYVHAQEKTTPAEGDIFLIGEGDNGSARIEVSDPTSSNGYKERVLKYVDDGAEHLLLYKGHMKSVGESAPTYSNTQRKVVYDSENGIYHSVYESNGDVYYTKSTDDGASWVTEELISGGDKKSHFPTITLCGDGYAVAYNYDNAQMKTKYISGSGVDTEVEVDHSIGGSCVPSVASVAIGDNSYVFCAWEDQYELKYCVFNADMHTMYTEGTVRVGGYTYGSQDQPRLSSAASKYDQVSVAWLENGWIFNKVITITVDASGNPIANMVARETIFSPLRTASVATWGPSIAWFGAGAVECAYEVSNAFSPVGGSAFYYPMNNTPRVFNVSARSHTGSWKGLAYRFGTPLGQSIRMSPSLGYGSYQNYRRFAGTRVPFNYDDGTVSVLALEKSGTSLRPHASGGASDPSITERTNTTSTLRSVYSVEDDNSVFDFTVRSEDAGLNKTTEYILAEGREMIVKQDTSYVSSLLVSPTYSEQGGSETELGWGDSRDTLIPDATADVYKWYCTDTVEASVAGQIDITRESYQYGESLSGNLVFHIQLRDAIDGSILIDSTYEIGSEDSDSALVENIQFDTSPFVGQNVYATMEVSGTVTVDDIWMYKTIIDISAEGKKGRPNHMVSMPSSIDITAHPNPASGMVYIKYDVEHAGYADVKLYDVYGRQVISSNQGYRGMGRHTMNLNLDNTRSGCYYIIVRCCDKQGVRRIVIMK